MIYSFLTSNYPITLIIACLAGVWAYRNRDAIRLVMFEDTPIWNLVGRVAVGSTVLGLAWITLFDNWRQMLGYLVQSRFRYRADPLEAALVSDGARSVSLVLLALSVIGLAALYARHRGAFVLLIVSLVLAPLYAYVFNEVRMRADVFLRTSDSALAGGQAVDIGFVLFWSTGLLIIIATVIVTAYFFLFALVGLPVRIIYALLTRKQEPEVSGVFRFYERHASGGSPDVPHDPETPAHLNHDARPG